MSDVKFYSVREAPFRIYGLYEPQAPGPFRRMPDEIAETVNEGVALRNKYPAGARVRFSTDSEVIVLRCTGLTEMFYDDNSAVGCCGFDLYLDDPDVGGRGVYSRYVHSFMPPKDFAKGYEIRMELPKGMHSYTLNFPPFNTLDDVYLGLSEGATVAEGLPYVNEKPIVFYGSSITHGATASRPGLAYTSLVCRRLNAHFLNFGFGGSARGEETMAKYLASLPMSCFVLDYDYNAPTVAHLRATHLPFYETVRAANPDIPILLLSRPSFHTYDRHGRPRTEDSEARRDVIIDTFRTGRAAGDKRLWYIDGESFFSGPDETECTVDGVHPTDLGMMKMADSVHRTMLRILNEVPFLSETESTQKGV